MTNKGPSGSASSGLGGMGHTEFVALMAAFSITIAVAIDIILPAFDEIKNDFGLAADSNSIALTISLYFLGIASAQMLYGPLADHFGRKPILAAGLVIYLLGAAASMMAPSLGVLLVARFVWGVGAASPRVLTNTIVRDVFEGDQMARVLSLVMSVFLIGPIVAPLIGEGLLQVSDWRVVFGASLLLGLFTLAWSRRLGETLDPAHHIPLGLARTRDGFRAVLSTRTTVGYGLALTFVFGILLTLLASSPLLFDVVYGRSTQFALLFSLASAVSAGAAYANSRLVGLIGGRIVMLVSGAGFVVLGAAITVLSMIGAGRPSFWVWYALVTAIFALISIFIPTGNALAMEPMGHLAGTASAVIGTFSLLGGTALGFLIDATLETSVTPMSFGFLIYGSLAMLSVVWAGWKNEDGSSLRNVQGPESGH